MTRSKVVKSIVVGMLCLQTAALMALGSLADGVVPEKSSLPDGMTRLLYIQGDGATTYFETDYRPNPQTDKVELQLSFVALDADQGFVSAGMGTPAWAFAYSVGERAMYGYYDKRRDVRSPTFILSLHTPYVFSIENNKVSWALGDWDIASASSTFQTPSEDLMLFAFRQSAEVKGFGSYKVYSVRVWRNGELLHYLVPVQTPQGEATLYDLATSPMTLTKHGTFAAGETGSWSVGSCMAESVDSDRMNLVVRLLGQDSHDAALTATFKYSESPDLAEGLTVVGPVQLSPSDEHYVSVMEMDGFSRYTQRSRSTRLYGRLTVEDATGSVVVRDISFYAENPDIVPLPPGYKALEYIQGDGSMTYFETDYRPNPQTDKVEVKLAFTSFAADQAIVACDGIKAPAAWSFAYSVGQKALYCCYDSQIGNWTGVCTVSLDTPYVFAFENNRLSWPGGDETFAADSSSFATTKEDLMLFGYRDSGLVKGVGSFKVYSVRVWRNGELLHDLVPVETPQGEATLYDLASSPMTLTRHGTFAGLVRGGWDVACKMEDVDTDTKNAVLSFQEVSPRDTTLTATFAYSTDPEFVEDVTLSEPFVLAPAGNPFISSFEVSGFSRYSKRSRTTRLYGRLTVADETGSVVVRDISFYAENPDIVPLPPGYKALEYIQGDGSTTYFETDYRPNPQTDKVEVKLAFTSFEADQAIVACDGIKAPAAWSFVYSVGRKALYCCYDSQIGNWTGACTVSLETPYVFAFENNRLSWPGGDELFAVVNPSFATARENLMLFGYRDSGLVKGVGSFKTYSVRVWRNGVMLHDLVPVETPHGEATLYDLASSPMTLTRYGAFACGPAKKCKRVGVGFAILVF